MKWWLFLLSLVVWPLTSTAETKVGLSPARVELDLMTGQRVLQIFTLKNYSDQTITVSPKVADVVPSDSPALAYQLLAETSTSSYALSSIVEESSLGASYRIAPGQSQAVPIYFSLASSSPVAEAYGTILFSIGSGASSTVKLTTEIGALVFARISGQGEERGALLDFGPVSEDRLRIIYANRGSLKLNPYGGLMLRQWWGKKLASRAIEPWFVLPQSERWLDVAVDDWPAGYYWVTLELNRGYNNEVDRRTIFWSHHRPSIWWLVGAIGIIIGLIWQWRRK